MSEAPSGHEGHPGRALAFTGAWRPVAWDPVPLLESHGKEGLAPGAKHTGAPDRSCYREGGGAMLLLGTPMCPCPEGLEGQPGSVGITWCGMGRCRGNAVREFLAGVEVLVQHPAAREGAAWGPTRQLSRPG